VIFYVGLVDGNGQLVTNLQNVTVKRISFNLSPIGGGLVYEQVRFNSANGLGGQLLDHPENPTYVTEFGQAGPPLGIVEIATSVSSTSYGPKNITLEGGQYPTR
jgi:hypothetical protein